MTENMTSTRAGDYTFVLRFEDGNEEWLDVVGFAVTGGAIDVIVIKDGWPTKALHLAEDEKLLDAGLTGGTLIRTDGLPRHITLLEVNE